MLTPQSTLPKSNQNLFPLTFTKTNMKAIAESNLTTPKTPVRKSEEETDLNPAEIKITGASFFLHISNLLCF